MKRSATVVLTSVMVGSGMSLAACGGETTPTQWADPPAAASSAATDAVAEGQSFASLEECKAAGDLAPAACDEAYAQAQADAPQFANQQSCEERYGVDQCVPRNQAGGGSFFTPLLTGFIVGQALSNLGGGRYGGRGYYRDRYGYNTLGNGQRLGTGALGGGARVGRDVFSPPRAQAPARVQSRSSVISRGGFGGGGGRSYGG